MQENIKIRKVIFKVFFFAGVLKVFIEFVTILILLLLCFGVSAMRLVGSLLPTCNPPALLCPQEFSRQEYWRGWPFPLPGDLPDPGIELVSPVLTGGFFITESLGKPMILL